MPFNGSGTFVPLSAPDYPAVTGTTISSTAYNNYTTDLMANGLSKVLVRDGQAAMTGNLNFGGFRGINLASPVAAGDAATLGTLAAYPTKANNLSDLASASTARANLGAQAALGFTPANKAGDAFTGAVSAPSFSSADVFVANYSFSDNPDIVLDNRGANSTDTTPYRIGGLYGAAFRDITNPAYVAGMWFERYSSAGGAASAGHVVFGVDNLGTATKTALVVRLRIAEGGTTVTGPAGGGSGLIVDSNSPNFGSLRLGNNVAFSGGDDLLGWSINYGGGTNNGLTWTNAVGLRIQKGSTNGGVLRLGDNCDLKGGSDFTNFRVAINAADVLTLDGSGNLVASGNITALSDRRLKTDIEPLADSLAAILAMQGVRFTRISDGSRQIGLIAQDVEAVRPEYVLTGADGLKSLAYQNIVADLIEAVKTLSARIAILEARA